MKTITKLIVTAHGESEGRDERIHRRELGETHREHRGRLVLYTPLLPPLH